LAGAVAPVAALLAACPLRVINCCGAIKVRCPLHPRKLPRHSLTGESALGQKLTHALQQNRGFQQYIALQENWWFFLLWTLGHTPQKPPEIPLCRMFSGVEDRYFSRWRRTWRIPSGEIQMKRLLVAGIAAAALYGAPALAAPPPTPAPVYSWTGFYLGANFGGGWGTNGRANFTPNDADSRLMFGVGFFPNFTNDYQGSGVIGGLQLGYNWQLNRNWLVGLESDFDGSGINGSVPGNSVFIDPGFGPLSTNIMNEKVDWFGTVRGRLGYLPTDNLLTYITGGFAYGRVGSTGNNSFLSSVAENIGGFGFLCAGLGATCLAGSSSSMATGWTVGAGLEYALGKNWTVKAEYLYVNLGNHTTTLTALVPNGADALTSFNATYTTTFNVARLGLNYRF
jgi:outer membrane immunogenic protein